jgi:Cu/Ag efflux pump CusA
MATSGAHFSSTTTSGAAHRIVVQCNVSGRDLRTVVNDIQRRVSSDVQVPQGYRVESGGQFES